MLRLIVSSIRSALRSAFRFIGRAMSLPGQLLGGFVGVPDPGDMPEQAPPEDLSAGRNEPVDNSEVYEAVANLVRMWCADSLIDDRPAPLPPKLPRKILEWLPGLTRDECDAIIQVDNYSVSAHCQGLYDIAGVRPVGRLPAMQEWPPETEKEVSPDFSDAVLEPLLGLPGVR